MYGICWLRYLSMKSLRMEAADVDFIFKENLVQNLNLIGATINHKVC